MARQKEFDHTAVLEQAMKLFWRKGYEATSMQDLVNSMGIGRGSIYDTFGSKEELYQEALAHYQNCSGSDVFSPLTRSNAGATEIIEVFENIVDAARNGADPQGCFAVQSAMERAYFDRQVAERFEGSLSYMEEMFSRALEQAQKSGDLPPERSVVATSQVLVNHVLGLRTLARTSPAHQSMIAVVDEVRTLLGKKFDAKTL